MTVVQSALVQHVALPMQALLAEQTF